MHGIGLGCKDCRANVNRHVMGCAGIAVRSGHHCTQPLHHALGISSSARASPYIYNTEAEVDNFVEALNSVIGILK